MTGPASAPAQVFRPKEPSVGKGLVLLSVLSFSSKQNCLAPTPASVPKAVPKGPSRPAEGMTVILLMGSKTDGTQRPKCAQEAGEAAARGGRKVWQEHTLLWGLIRS